MLTLDGLSLRQGAFGLGASLSVAAPGRVAVMGPSGAGKSTLLLALAGFIRPEAGRILWNGADITAARPMDRPVTMVFQDNNLFPHLTAFQNVALGLRPSLRLRPDEAARVEAALGRVGLAGLGGRKPAELSGGQQSRVTLARAILRDKPIVLLDEPFAALGPALKAEMLDLVAELLPRALVLMVTHDPADARRLAPETILVADGQALPPVATAGLLDTPPPALARYLGK
jgi:thiamine transport system ATP-binding protein